MQFTKNNVLNIFNEAKNFLSFNLIIHLLLIILGHLLIKSNSFVLLNQLIDKTHMSLNFDSCFTLLFFAPVLEEFLYRYLLMTLFLGKIKKKYAILISTIFFSMVHPLRLIYITLIGGWMLGAVYYKYKNIFLNMLLHALYNLLVILWSGFIHQMFLNRTYTTLVVQNPLVFYLLIIMLLIMLVLLIKQFIGYIRNLKNSTDWQTPQTLEC